MSVHIRKATPGDLSRVAEIFVFNNRMNFFPIFQDEGFSFGTMQVLPMAEAFGREEVLENLYVYDDGLIRGFLQRNGCEICKLYVDPFFQGRGIGAQLITYAIGEFHAGALWALERNTRAIAFYQRHGFHQTGQRQLEEGTTEYLVKLER